MRDGVVLLARPVVEERVFRRDGAQLTAHFLHEPCAVEVGRRPDQLVRIGRVCAHVLPVAGARLPVRHMPQEAPPVVPADAAVEQCKGVVQLRALAQVAIEPRVLARSARGSARGAW